MKEYSLGEMLDALAENSNRRFTDTLGGGRKDANFVTLTPMGNPAICKGGQSSPLYIEDFAINRNSLQAKYVEVLETEEVVVDEDATEALRLGLKGNKSVQHLVESGLDIFVGKRVEKGGK